MAEVRGGRVVSLRGDPHDPVLRGRPCGKSAALLKRLYGPERLLHPVMRTGSGWRRVTWQDAISAVVEKVESARERHGGKSILLYHEWGSRGYLKSLEKRFFNALGSVTLPSGDLCFSAGLAAQRYDFGANLAHDPTDLANTRLAVLWGRNPAVTNVHTIPHLLEAKKRGARAVLVDPARSASASLADIHVAPRPGTDAALALGMAHFIIAEGLLDTDFVGNRTLGFERFRDMVEHFSPEVASRICDVPPSEICRFAGLYAASKPAAILIGYGVQRYANGGHTVRAIDALAALTGNIGVSGGGANYATRASAGCLAPVDGAELRKEARFFPRPILAECILRARASDAPVKVMFVTRANPVNQVPNSEKMQRAFAAVDFKVVVDIRMSETARQADIVLPATGWLEESDIITSSWHDYIMYTEQAVEPAAECMGEKDIFGRLSREMGLETGLDKPIDYWADEALRPLNDHGITAASLRGRWVRVPGAPAVPWSDGKFATPSGKYEFYSIQAEREAHDPLPSWIPPAEAGDESLAADYPFIFVSSSGPGTMHSQFSDSILRDGALEIRMSPAAMAGLGLRDGCRVVVEAPGRGRLEGIARAVAGQRDDTVSAYEGASVLKRSGANLLTPDRQADFGGQAAFNDCRVRVVKTP
jgi:anaerobic selenocysteine-containing dehydrogenase